MGKYREIKRIKPGVAQQKAIVPDQLIFHSAGDNYVVEGHIGWQHSQGLESHAYTAKDGTRYQITPYTVMADANYRANRRSDGHGALSMESGSSIAAGEGWTDPQLESMAEWGIERIRQFPTILPRICPAWDAPGLGYHIMFGTPGAWTPVAKACPGPLRISQFKRILVPAIIRGVTSGSTVIDLGAGTQLGGSITGPAKGGVGLDPIPGPDSEWFEKATRDDVLLAIAEAVA